MIERAEARDVSLEALQAALDASASALGDKDVPKGSVERLAKFESEGYRALCALMEVGHSHYRTFQLLRATWQPGDERHLLALAGDDDLPNFASWAVLRGLGASDTPEVRTYLTNRLREEDDSGLFMATAQGLADLGLRETAGEIGDRVLEYREKWTGVERHLISSLTRLGGPVAIDRLEKIATDERTTAWQGALAGLEHLDPEAAERARKTRDGR